MTGPRFGSMPYTARSKPMSMSARIHRALGIGLVAAFTAGTAALIAAISILAREADK